MFECQKESYKLSNLRARKVIFLTNNKAARYRIE